MNIANEPRTANSDQIASIGSYDECEGIREMNDVNICQWHVFISHVNSYPVSGPYSHWMGIGFQILAWGSTRVLLRISLLSVCVIDVIAFTFRTRIGSV